MGLIRIAVAEDEEEFLRIIREYLERYEREAGLAFSVRCFPDGEDLLEDYEPVYDLLFMDIQMRFMDGMTAAKKVRELDPKVGLVFLTSTASFAIQGYEVDALDYILKPVSYEMFARRLKRVLEKLPRGEEDMVLLPLREGTIRLEASKILYIESRSHQMIYHTAERELSVRGRMEDLEKEMAPYGFFRSNRGYLVNLDRVKAIKDDCCVIGEEMLPISRQKKARLMEELTKRL